MAQGNSTELKDTQDKDYPTGPLPDIEQSNAQKQPEKLNANLPYNLSSKEHASKPKQTKKNIVKRALAVPFSMIRSLANVKKKTATEATNINAPSFPAPEVPARASMDGDRQYPQSEILPEEIEGNIAALRDSSINDVDMLRTLRSDISALTNIGGGENALFEPVSPIASRLNVASSKTTDSGKQDSLSGKPSIETVDMDRQDSLNGRLSIETVDMDRQDSLSKKLPKEIEDNIAALRDASRATALDTSLSGNIGGGEDVLFEPETPRTPASEKKSNTHPLLKNLGTSPFECSGNLPSVMENGSSNIEPNELTSFKSATEFLPNTLSNDTVKLYTGINDYLIAKDVENPDALERTFTGGGNAGSLLPLQNAASKRFTDRHLEGKNEPNILKGR